MIKEVEVHYQNQTFYMTLSESVAVEEFENMLSQLSTLVFATLKDSNGHHVYLTKTGLLSAVYKPIYER